MTPWLVELNADVAEGAPHDDAILGLVQRANVCLGVHAGNPALTELTMSKCRDLGVKICAHPGYPDREFFGRRALPAIGLEVNVVSQSLQEQLARWIDRVDAIKPHGGFYNDSTDPGPAFDLLVELLVQTRKPLLGMPRTHHEVAAQTAGVAFIPEGFADRAYTANGRLVPRTQPGAYVGLAQLAEHLTHLQGTVRSLCVHGDGDDPVGRLEAVIEWLGRHEVEVRAWTP